MDVVELHGCDAVNLDDDFAGGHRVVVHVGIEVGEAAGGEGCHLVCVEGVSHPDFESSRDDRFTMQRGSLLDIFIISSQVDS
jgi:hypothetical protein